MTEVWEGTNCCRGRYIKRQNDTHTRPNAHTSSHIYAALDQFVSSNDPVKAREEQDEEEEEEQETEKERRRAREHRRILTDG